MLQTVVVIVFLSKLFQRLAAQLKKRRTVDTCNWITTIDPTLPGRLIPKMIYILTRYWTVCSNNGHTCPQRQKAEGKLLANERAYKHVNNWLNLYQYIRNNLNITKLIFDQIRLT